MNSVPVSWYGVRTEWGLNPAEFLESFDQRRNVLGALLRRGERRTDADDAVQNAAEKVLRRGPDFFRGPAHLVAYWINTAKFLPLTERRALFHRRGLIAINIKTEKRVPQPGTEKVEICGVFGQLSSKERGVLAAEILGYSLTEADRLLLNSDLPTPKNPYARQHRSRREVRQKLRTLEETPWA